MYLPLLVTSCSTEYHTIHEKPAPPLIHLIRLPPGYPTSYRANSP